MLLSNSQFEAFVNSTGGTMRAMTQMEVSRELAKVSTFFGTEHMDTEAIVIILGKLPLDFLCQSSDDTLVFRTTRPLTAPEAWQIGSMCPDTVASWIDFDPVKHNGDKALLMVNLPRTMGKILLNYNETVEFGDVSIVSIDADQTTFYLWFNE